MRRTSFLLITFLLGLAAMAQPQPYSWTSQSHNSSESMPCGGGDVGMNVWVEQGDVLFYLSRSGCFDENNTLLKLGRFRLHFSHPLANEGFRQQLTLADGSISMSDGQTTVTIWADVTKPVVHVEATSRRQQTLELTYETWRTTPRPMTRREAFQSSWKFALPTGTATTSDSILAETDALMFLHQNPAHTIFDDVVEQQQMQEVKHQLFNPIGNLIFGGRMQGEGLAYKDRVEGTYASTPYVGFRYASTRPSRQHHAQIVLATLQGTITEWRRELEQTEHSVHIRQDRQVARQWWRQYWEHSYIETSDTSAVLQQLLRNYTLFRYMLGCNCRGPWPTKFNGGLFTFDPEYVKPNEADYRLSPDFRNWGGGVHTAQNQRLVYWSMLKSGDTDLLLPQLEFYRRTLANAELRSQVYWHHAGAAFTEQMENFGLPNPAEYGRKRPEGSDPGMERNAWLEYEWDTALEFCQMALLAASYDAAFDITPYLPLVQSVLTFFDEHYQYLARQRGAKTLDGEGHLVLYPGSGGETYKGAYNSTSTIAALTVVATSLIDYLGQQQQPDSLSIAHWQDFLRRLPPISHRRQGDVELIAPALHWERIQNVETTQLYPVFPWRLYGLEREGLQVARNTYEQDTLALRFRSHVGWKQDNIWAACLGLTNEAQRLTTLKLADGPHRFPAFWGPGFDWTPDHNWGGSAMIGLQEMLLQETPDGQLLLFPAWPREWDVTFRLHASQGRTVEATLRQGRVEHVYVKSPKAN